MDYERKVKSKLPVLALLGIIGIAAASEGFYMNFGLGRDNFTSMYLMGTGCGLIIISVIMLIKKLRLLKDKNKLKLQKIQDEDERNQLLSFKSSHYSLLITISGVYLVSFYFAFTDEAVLHILADIICMMVFLRFAIFYILRGR